MIGQRIREIRNQNNLTQEALSDGIISRTYLSLIEKGSVEPSNNVLIRLSERLGVSVSDLMEEAKSSYHDPINVRREILFNENKLSRDDLTNVGRFVEESEAFVSDLDYLDQGRMYLIYARYYYLKEEYKEALRYIELSYNRLKEVSLSIYFIESALLYSKLHLHYNEVEQSLDFLEPLLLEINNDQMYALQTRDLLDVIIKAYFIKDEYFTVTRLLKHLRAHSTKYGLVLSSETRETEMISLYHTHNFDTLNEVLRQNDTPVSHLLTAYLFLDEDNVMGANEIFKTLNSDDYLSHPLESVYLEMKDRLGSL